MNTLYNYHIDGTLPQRTHWVWVFGSNEAGIHGGGAARVAHELYNRPYGTAIGLYTSYNLQDSYAIPTKNKRIETLPIDKIKKYVDDFKNFTEDNPSKIFFVTRVGCFLAGYEDKDIAPLFKGISSNCSFAESWKQYLE